jgi:hypothetical protein
MLPISSVEMDRVLARIGFAVAAVLLLLLTARCGLVRSHRSDNEPRDTETRSSAQQSPSDATPPAPQSQVVAPVPEPPPVPQPHATEPTAPSQRVVPEPGVSAAAPVTPTPRGKPSAPPAAKRPAARPQPAHPATSATPAEPARKSAAPGAKAPAPAAPLDLNKLKQELKDTKAIGVFSKLTLKNQMDDLLATLRKFHQGKGKVTLADLHRSYELLVMKVLSLVQDDDQKLASDIVSSREAIWSVLADPKTFAALQL